MPRVDVRRQPTPWPRFAKLVVDDGIAYETDLHERLLTTRLPLPPARRVAVASADEMAGPLVVGAFRDGRAGRGDSERAKTLASFAHQAALSVANARLFEEIEAAYLHQLDLNRQKGEFVATVSHELRTPVAAIIGTIETVSRLGDRLDDERRAGLLAGAVGYGERLSRVIEELLLVAAAEQSTATVRATELDLASFVQRLVKETSVVTEGRVVAAVRPSNVEIRTDESKLERILVNLIENAREVRPRRADRNRRHGRGRSGRVLRDRPRSRDRPKRPRPGVRAVRAARSVARRGRRVASVSGSICASSSPRCSTANSSSPRRRAEAPASALP